VGWALALAVACGGRAEDTTTLIEPPVQEPEQFDVGQSRALAALAQPATRDAFCGWLGASASGLVGPGAALDCETVTRECREAIAAPGALDEDAALPLGLLGLPNDLEELAGCPVSVSSLDACAAELLTLIVERYPDGPGCTGSIDAPQLELNDLATLESCLSVVVSCPQLLQELLDAMQ
jgi:hypothetical protein